MSLVKPENLKWWILLTVIVGTFLGRMDQTIVGLATPKIMDDFGITIQSAGWISTAYIIANAVFVPIWGKMGDILGRKKIYTIGFSIFIVGSVLCGLAWNLSSMIVFRIIQAIAGSADYPTAMSILTYTFKEGKERNQALGLWSVSFAAAAVFGPLIGGPLIDHMGWPWVFMINVPVGIIGLVMALYFIKESKSEQSNASFDWLGSLTLGGSLATLVMVLDRGLEWGWFSTYSIICYILCVLFFVIFIKVEKRVKEPVIDLNFFKIPNFNYALLNNFIVFMGMMSVVYLIPIFAQQFLGFNATKTGLLFMPMAAAMMIASPIGASLTGKVKASRVIFYSGLVNVVGIYLFRFIDVRSTPIDIIIPLAIMAFGMGFGMAQRTAVVSSSVPKSEIGSASSVLALIRSISGAVGIALFSTMLTNVTNSKVLSITADSNLNAKSLVDYKEFIGLVVLKAEISAYTVIFSVAALIVLVGTFFALRIKIKKEQELSSSEMVMVE